MKFLRWLSTPISFLALCGIFPLLGYFIVNWFDRFCAPEQFIAGSCVATWHVSAIDATIYGVAFVLSLLLVIVPATIAPVGKKITSVVAFLFWAAMLSGLSFLFSRLPGSMAIGWAVLAVPMAISVAGGGIGLLVVRSRTAKTI
ncbi:MAG: hypothetical protein O7E57_09565 [Gammaproteobacteria bacterium]|nr:hypothetical protein [Gammaproteobacteria bacterium]